MNTDEAPEEGVDIIQHHWNVMKPLKENHNLPTENLLCVLDTFQYVCSVNLHSIGLMRVFGGGVLPVRSLHPRTVSLVCFSVSETAAAFLRGASVLEQ